MRLARSYAILAAVLAILEGGGMIARKQFLRDGFGIAAILAAQSAPAILVRSMVAARGSFFGMGGGAKVPTAADYVQDGLIAMWDGIANAGWGVHDANATKPFDLISGSSENIASTFVANKDNIEVTTVNAANRATHFSSACANALTSGNLYVECLVYSNMPTTAVYGNFLGLFNGSFGYNRHSGKGGISIFSSGWVSAIDVSLVDAPVARLAVSIDSNLGTIRYSVGSQEANGTVTIPQPLHDVQWVNTVGTKIFSMRAYNRQPTAAEIAANNAIDKERFNQT